MTTSTGEARPRDESASTKRVIPADTFALRLKAIRLHAGDITIVQAADRVGVTNQSWSNWEGGAMPRDFAGVVEVISEEFGIDRDWLMWGGPLSRQEPSRQLRSIRRSRTRTDKATYRPRTPRTRPPGYPERAGRPVLLRDPLRVR